MQHPRSKRKLSNTRLTAKFHIQYMGVWILLALALIVLLDLAYIKNNELILASAAIHNPDIAAEAATLQSQFINKMIFNSFLLGTGVLALAVITAHHIAGPYLGLRRTFNNIKDGDLDCRLGFRSYDRLQEVVDDFNNMMDILQARIASREPEDAQETGSTSNSASSSKA